MKAKNRSDGHRRVSADSIYLAQNKQIHKALTALGMPYNTHREYWIDVLRNRLRVNVTGLSGLTLGERSIFLADLKKQGTNPYNPWVPRYLMNWRKGNPPASEGYGATHPTKVITVSGKSQGFPGRPSEKMFGNVEKGLMLGKIEAMLAEAKRPWSYVHAMAKRMYGMDRVEWCRPLQIHSIVAALVMDAKRHGRNYE